MYAIPGLGTTKELFRSISIPNYEIKVLEWPAPKPNYTLKDYSKQFLPQIDQSKPINLMGVSFGGMLCSELAEQVNAKKVVLISSCKDVSEFSFLLKLFKIIPAHRLFTDKFFRMFAGTTRKFLGFERSFKKEFFKMIEQMPENYFYYCINYIIRWDKKESLSGFIRIHGTADRLLTYYESKTFHLINAGSHAMILNKADEINKILNKQLNGI